MVPNEKSSIKYYCEYCNYFTSRKSQYNRHILTDKHKSYINPIQKKFESEKIYNCICGKSYKHSSTLYAHKKICKGQYHTEENKQEIIETKLLDTNNKTEQDKELLMMLIKQNAELMEIIKNGTHNTMNNSHNTTNSHNKAFNLNFFLNETCKNAMNISDFVDSIKLQLSDLMDVGELGYVEGISKIIVNKLNSLDETVRPIHCTDKKRETIYIKDEGQWEKDDDNKTKLRKSIKKISDKNMKLLQVFREKYPDCREAESIYCNKYCKMVIEAMGGMGFTTTQQEEKIIKNISKATGINKCS